MFVPYEALTERNGVFNQERRKEIQEIGCLLPQLNIYYAGG